MLKCAAFLVSVDFSYGWEIIFKGILLAYYRHFFLIVVQREVPTLEMEKETHDPLILKPDNDSRYDEIYQTDEGDSEDDDSYSDKIAQIKNAGIVIINRCPEYIKQILVDEDEYSTLNISRMVNAMHKFQKIKGSMGDKKITK